MDDALYQHVQQNLTHYPLGHIVRTSWDGEEMLIYRSLVASNNLELLQVMRFDKMYHELITLHNLNLVVLVLALVLMALVLYLLMLGLSRPLRSLYQQVGIKHSCGWQNSHNYRAGIPRMRRGGRGHQ